MIVMSELKKLKLEELNHLSPGEAADILQEVF